MPAKFWRCRFCEYRNPWELGCCYQCWRPFIVDQQELLRQTAARPSFTPLWWGKGGKGGSKGGPFLDPKGGSPGSKGAVGFSKGSGKEGKGHPPNFGATGVGWRVGRQRGKRDAREAKDAALAASLAAADDSEVESLGPQGYLAAARTNLRAAKQVAPFNPEASAMLEASSRTCFTQALEARPLAEQIKILNKKRLTKKA